MIKLIKLSCFLMSLLAFNVFSAVERIDQVVALVDNDVVLNSELTRRLETVIQQLKSNNRSIPAIDKLEKQILERLISESLQLQIAKRIGVRVNDTELDKTLEKISLDNKMFISAFRKQIEDSGTPWAIFREDIRKEIMISRARQADVLRRIKVSEKEVDNLVALINKEGENRTQYSLGHILLPIDEGVSSDELNQLRLKADKLVSDLRNGANFQEYAVTYSAGQNALSGGDLGWKGASQLPSLFANSVKNMKVGDVSEPLRSGSGLHILYLQDVKGGFGTHQVIQTHARHILIQPNEILDEKAALDKIELVRQRILKGESFEDLAVEFSDDKGSGSQGGDLKWVNPGSFVPEFSEVMDALKLNELSQPVKTQFGWHIIEVLERRDQDQTEDKKRERAYKILQTRKFEEEAQLWERGLRTDAYIKILKE